MASTPAVTCQVEAAQRATSCQVFVILDALIGVQTSKWDGGRNEDGDSRIYAVNSFVEVGVQLGDVHVKDHSLRYLESLNRKLGKVAYHRVVQLSHFDMACLERHPDESIAELVAENYLAHYREIVEAGQQGKEAVLEAVLGKYPTCFVLVQNAADGKCGGRLIWQMHQHVDGRPREDIVELTAGEHQSTR
ncbi:hypothetical protein ACFY3B_21660 [Micromonospora parva]|uniref:Uncharacterized protein n=1 Tax=Micromonospora parva TaxID=1464048 RepID=A0ABW6VX45_9ACTN